MVNGLWFLVSLLDFFYIVNIDRDSSHIGLSVMFPWPLQYFSWLMFVLTSWLQKHCCSMREAVCMSAP
jgi:hypothetical protein